MAIGHVKSYEPTEGEQYDSKFAQRNFIALAHLSRLQLYAE